HHNSVLAGKSREKDSRTPLITTANRAFVSAKVFFFRLGAGAIIRRMVDIHCHLLPNVDDGPRSWDICLQMCEMAQADGIEHIVATPHANDEFRYDREALSRMLKELSQRVSGKLQLSLGCDFHLSYENLVEVLRNPSRYTISGTNYLLVELS